ncbi:hypothetical protein DAMNIGENAA_06050 [Desulforhabdus amnigena]|uniref:Uncharacterized protein n=1 Tax=Desulforhabdus amnigena TaxID=40218 RepID=A0A9W6CZI6_9BACT|nr:hypothetical protein DAMNIGENAA_06050 [Desulforhabdus amnigena]
MFNDLHVRSIAIDNQSKYSRFENPMNSLFIFSSTQRRISSEKDGEVFDCACDDAFVFGGM